MELKLSKYIRYSDYLSQDQGATGKRIILSTRKSMGISVTNFVVDLVKESNFTVLPNHLFNVMMFHEIVIPNDQEETEEILKIKGIIGEDASENSVRLIVDIKKLNENDLYKYLDYSIAQVNISSKVKTVLVEIRAPIKGYIINGSKLDEIKSYINNNESLSKIKVEYKLICGIPDSNPLIINDFTWINSLEIIYFANGSPSDFNKDMNRLKTFSENIKLINKAKVRIILPNNFGELLANSHDIINTIKDCIFRFNLRKEGYEKFDDWSKKELNLLNTISEYEIHCVQFSDAANHFLDESFIYKNDFHYEYFEDFILEVKDDDFKRIDKKIITTDRVKVLKEKSPQCYECMFLSMCGGMITKSATHNMDCPDLRSNIMVKSRMKYKI